MQDMTPDWPLVRQRFDEALALPAPERAAFVAALKLDEASRAELQSLLAHHDDATEGEPLLRSGNSSNARAGVSRAGEHFGPWDIVGPLGEGGMGEVFEARRADGSYEGRAAIKVLKRGMDSAAVLQRFTQERQALARLVHPNIAHMLDAGLSSDGLPYFVMEYVDGRPIDAAARGLPLERRIDLFLQLADAVAYAHRNLLVHRDLKPGNVLVTQEGQVKLLDFGIAKALDGDADAGGSDTTVGTPRPFTPNYASPEQVRGEPVNTATDIYSLGVILHELLTGLRPTGRGASTGAESARSVLTEQPVLPSTLPEAEVKDTGWLQTRRRLQGDLDNIVLKALEKAPDRRYASVADLARDLRDHLRGHPVSARPRSRRYVMGLFVARNRGAVAGAAAAVLALCVGIGATAWQAHRADQQRDLAQQRLVNIRAITSDVILQFSDAIAEMPKALGVQEKLLTDTLSHLDRLAADADPAFKGDLAVVYAHLAETQVANGLNSLNKDADAEHNAARAVALFEAAEPQSKGPYYFWWARSLRALALAARGHGDVDAGLAHLERARDVCRQGLARLPGDADVRNVLGSTLFNIGQFNDTVTVHNKGRQEAASRAFDEAEAVFKALYEEALAKPKEFSPEDVGSLAFQLGTIEGARAILASKYGRLAEALPLHASAVGWKLDALKAEPDNVGYRSAVSTEAGNEAMSCMEKGDLPCALQASKLAWDTSEKLQKDDPREPSWLVNDGRVRGAALLMGGEAAQAVPMLRLSETAMLEAVAKAAKAGKTPTSSRAPYRLASVQKSLAIAHGRLGRFEEARRVAATAASALTALRQADPNDREAWLASAQLAAEQSSWPGADRAVLRKLALDCLDHAASLQALWPQGPDAQLRAALLTLKPS